MKYTKLKKVIAQFIIMIILLSSINTQASSAPSNQSSTDESHSLWTPLVPSISTLGSIGTEIRKFWNFKASTQPETPPLDKEHDRKIMLDNISSAKTLIGLKKQLHPLITNKGNYKHIDLEFFRRTIQFKVWEIANSASTQQGLNILRIDRQWKNIRKNNNYQFYKWLGLDHDKFYEELNARCKDVDRKRIHARQNIEKGVLYKITSSSSLEGLKTALDTNKNKKLRLIDLTKLPIPTGKITEIAELEGNRIVQLTKSKVEQGEPVHLYLDILQSELKDFHSSIKLPSVINSEKFYRELQERVDKDPVNITYTHAALVSAIDNCKTRDELEKAMDRIIEKNKLLEQVEEKQTHEEYLRNVKDVIRTKTKELAKAKARELSKEATERSSGPSSTAYLKALLKKADAFLPTFQSHHPYEQLGFTSNTFNSYVKATLEDKIKSVITTEASGLRREINDLSTPDTLSRLEKLKRLKATLLTTKSEYTRHLKYLGFQDSLAHFDTSLVKIIDENIYTIEDTQQEASDVKIVAYMMSLAKNPPAKLKLQGLSADTGFHQIIDVNAVKYTSATILKEKIDWKNWGQMAFFVTKSSTTSSSTPQKETIFATIRMYQNDKGTFTTKDAIEDACKTMLPEEYNSLKGLYIDKNIFSECDFYWINLSNKTIKDKRLYKKYNTKDPETQSFPFGEKIDITKDQTIAIEISSNILIKAKYQKADADLTAIRQKIRTSAAKNPTVNRS